MTGQWGGLRNEKLYFSHFSQNIRLIKKNEVDGACGTQGRQEICIQGFGGEPERNRLFGRSRPRWQDKMGHQEVEWGGMDRIDLAEDRDMWRELVNAVMNLGVPQNAGNFLTSRKPASF